jgi:hypothetical protein
VEDLSNRLKRMSTGFLKTGKPQGASQGDAATSSSTGGSAPGAQPAGGGSDQPDPPDRLVVQPAAQKPSGALPPGRLSLSA